ncbi:MAG: hypothetical protein Q9195_009369 [Heterodermia aff. obscurata]
MKYPLKRFTIAVTGDFGHARTHEKMKQWTEHNGGEFSREISNEVTHLVCSKEHYKNMAPFVLQAKHIPSIKIVSYDWLEDSLMNHRPLREEPYLMKRRNLRDVEKRAKKRETRKQNIKKGSESSCLYRDETQHLIRAGSETLRKELVHALADGYQIYRDHTSFPYDITLVRANLLENKHNACHLKVRPPPLPSLFSSPPPLFPIVRPPFLLRARVHILNVRAQRLQLYESHSVPKYYACFVRYSESGHKTMSEVLSPTGSSLEGAMGVFRMFFALKTGVVWEERLLPRKNRGEDVYVYRPPLEGEARGVLEGEEISERDAVALESLLRQIEQRELGLTRGEY